MSNYIESVKEFHENFNHPINNYKHDIDIKLRQLRINLLFEELRELVVASDVQATFFNLCNDVVQSELGNVSISKDGNSVNKKEEIDGLCDIQVILSGTILCLGYQDIFDKSFDEVHRSNMSKMCSNLEEVDLTKQFYLEKGVESYHVEKGDKYIVLRTQDNKILKNVNYSEANLNQFL